jgi:multidrug efflux system outer membrane protein
VAALENVLALLQGRPPGPGPALPAVLQLPVALPAGLPSSLLEQRPDLRQSEQRMVAANARVGEAKALFLPSLSITGAFGAISGQLDELLRGSAQDVASLGPNVSQVLYAGGALVANRDAAIARSEQAVLAYRAAVLNALREVADALIAYDRSGEEFEQQVKRAAATQAALRLADRRFAAGVVSYLEVLDAQRQLLAAETDLVNSKLNRQLALVQAYRALGGGWEGR